jgi:diguanylate cyclase (GGDEF)-like protein
MLSEQELQQICRKYELACPICETTNNFARLKPDICRPGQQEGDGHPRVWRWTKPGFDSVDPKLFFWGVCQKCRFAGELDDADFRTSYQDPDGYKSRYSPEGLQRLVQWSSSGKGVVQALGKLLSDDDPLASTLVKFHLGVFSQCLLTRFVAGNIARYYLRVAWLYRDREVYYRDADLERFVQRMTPLKEMWDRDLPKNKEYPAAPQLGLDEAGALRLSRAFFERNYETLREAKPEDELRLRFLLAEIGFRLYQLTSDTADYRKAASFYSGSMQKCLSVISDKSIVGGVVNRAREMLEQCGERGRQLRELHKSRGGEEEAEAAAAEKKDAGAAKKAAAPAAAREEENPAEEPATQAKEPPSAPGLRPELDQATRQLTVLQNEVSTLREKVGALEEDNKRWRQMVGRDALTGLPNRVALFRLNLPKALKALGADGALSFVALSLDQVAKINQEHGWSMGDRMLLEAVKGVRALLGEGEELYRLDGINFVLAGRLNLNDARQRAADLRRRLAAANAQIDKTSMPLNASLGVVVVERKSGKPELETANAVYQRLLTTLYRARDKGGSVEVHTETKF